MEGARGEEVDTELLDFTPEDAGRASKYISEGEVRREKDGSARQRHTSRDFLARSQGLEYDSKKTAAVTAATER